MMIIILYTTNSSLWTFNNAQHLFIGICQYRFSLGHVSITSIMIVPTVQLVSNRIVVVGTVPASVQPIRGEHQTIVSILGIVGMAPRRERRNRIGDRCQIVSKRSQHHRKFSFLYHIQRVNRVKERREDEMAAPVPTQPRIDGLAIVLELQRTFHSVVHAAMQISVVHRELLGVLLVSRFVVGHASRNPVPGCMQPGSSCSCSGGCRVVLGIKIGGRFGDWRAIPPMRRFVRWCFVRCFFAENGIGGSRLV
mmetsp:Transcript_10895/g.12440  ORF Transcript_10895/g.12440 Transcript_10895/m.12440 type:complete len:251 (+) Transcript_10895:807-1559(+)